MLPDLVNDALSEDQSLICIERFKTLSSITNTDNANLLARHWRENYVEAKRMIDGREVKKPKRRQLQNLPAEGPGPFLGGTNINVTNMVQNVTQVANIVHNNVGTSWWEARDDRARRRSRPPIRQQQTEQWGRVRTEQYTWRHQEWNTNQWQQQRQHNGQWQTSSWREENTQWSTSRSYEQPQNYWQGSGGSSTPWTADSSRNHDEAPWRDWN